MLSILIPTYNYNTFPLVKELHDQISLENIDFEIIVSDDASTDLTVTKENQEITNLRNCYYLSNIENLGRGSNRNKLCKKAKYDWLLLLDCDTLPGSSSFIKNYLDCINSNNGAVFFGGIAYYDNKPLGDEILRWTYGRKREAIPLLTRQKKTYETSLVSNILLKKQILLKYPFNPSIYEYGFEDFVFISDLKKNGIPIIHIENPAYHLNLETSIVFLSKHLSAIDNLNSLIIQGIIKSNETALGKTQETIKRLMLQRIVVFFFNLSKQQLRQNLLSKNPSLVLFDFYKLGYFCSIKNL
jgi:glycosyltransferase involved in cell wall biosynthesis